MKAATTLQQLANSVSKRYMQVRKTKTCSKLATGNSNKKYKNQPYVHKSQDLNFINISPLST